MDEDACARTRAPAIPRYVPRRGPSDRRHVGLLRRSPPAGRRAPRSTSWPSTG